MGKMARCLGGVLVLAMMAGCQSIQLDRREYTGAGVTDAFIQAPVQRTFQLPPRRPPSSVRGRDKLVGKWQCHQTTNAKFATASYGRMGHTYRMELDVEYSFSDDGTMVLRRKHVNQWSWTVQHGTWEYSGNTLSVWLGGRRFDSRITWYDDFEMLMKDADLEQQARLIDSCRMWYDADDCKHMSISQYGEHLSIESPPLFRKTGGSR